MFVWMSRNSRSTGLVELRGFEMVALDRTAACRGTQAAQNDLPKPCRPTTSQRCLWARLLSSHTTYPHWDADAAACGYMQVENAPEVWGPRWMLDGSHSAERAAEKQAMAHA